MTSMYLGESIGNVFQKATGVGWFRDRYLDGFLGVASLIATSCVSFKEHHCRKDDLYPVIFQVDWRMCIRSGRIRPGWQNSPYVGQACDQASL